MFVTHATWALERTPGMVSHVRPELVLADSGLPCDTFNFICRARLNRSAARAGALDAVSYFAGVQRPFSWWVGPADQPTDLGAVLQQIGLLEAETELAMAVTLDALSDSMPPISALEVSRVRSAVELETFARLSAANWDPPDQQVLTFYRRTAGVLLNAAAPQWLYLGCLDGEPVATAEAPCMPGPSGCSTSPLGRPSAAAGSVRR